MLIYIYTVNYDSGSSKVLSCLAKGAKWKNAHCTPEGKRCSFWGLEKGISDASSTFRWEYGSRL